MDDKEFYIDCGFYKEKAKGRISTLRGRAVGIVRTDEGDNVIDIKTGLSVWSGGDNATENAVKMMDVLIAVPEDTLQNQINKFKNLPVAEPDKIVIRKDERKISGMLNYKYFNCVITESQEGIAMELEEAQLYTPEECDMIIDQLQEVLKDESSKS